MQIRGRVKPVFDWFISAGTTLPPLQTLGTGLYYTVTPLILEQDSTTLYPGTGLYYTVSWNRTLLTPLTWEQDCTTL